MKTANETLGIGTVLIASFTAICIAMIAVNQWHHTESELVCHVTEWHPSGDYTVETQQQNVYVASEEEAMHIREGETYIIRYHRGTDWRGNRLTSATPTQQEPPDTCPERRPHKEWVRMRSDSLKSFIK